MTSIVSGGSPNVPDYTEDPNSPLTISAASSGTITLANTYDRVLLVAVENDFPVALEMRVNGDTSTNYNFTDESGTRSTGWARWNNLVPQASQGVALSITGRWSNVCHAGRVEPASTGNETMNGDHYNVASPLSSITIYDNGGRTGNAKFRVYGWSG